MKEDEIKQERVRKYLRFEILPTAFCPGCGCGTVLNAFVQALDEMEIDPKEIVFVTGIGCSSWIPSPYFRGDILHTTHGRPLAFATGVKVMKPGLKVIVIAGDGDIAGIGGNHLIHAARRNIDISVFMVNNWNYGMTGGQVSPCTPQEIKSKTSVYGNPETPFDAVELARAAGASYISRWTTAHPVQLHKAITGAIEHEGFALVEAISQCPTQAGRLSHGISDPVQLLDKLKSHTIGLKKAQKTDPEDLQGKFVIGNLLKNQEALEFACSYSRIAAKAVC